MIANKNDLEIIVGTYEDYVVGYEAETRTRKENGDSRGVRPTQMYLEQSFAVRGHSGSVRCMTSSPDGAYIASAGYDEMINLFSLKRRKLLQTTERTPVNCAAFVGNSHLICGSEDSNIYIYECSSSQMKLVKTLKGHKSAIKSIDAHPSGKILLSIAKDQSMRTWNLIKGRCAYVTNIRTEAHLVKWSRTGDEFVIAANNEIYLYNNSGLLKQCLKLDKRVNSVEFLGDRVFAVAIDSGKLEFFDLGASDEEDCKSLLRLDAHETRIKSVCCLVRPKVSNQAKQKPESDADDEGSSEDDDADDGATMQVDAASSAKPETLFATASSDGTVKVWSTVITSGSSMGQPLEMARVDAGARLTCMIISLRRAIPSK